MEPVNVSATISSKSTYNVVKYDVENNEIEPLTIHLKQPLDQISKSDIQPLAEYEVNAWTVSRDTISFEYEIDWGYSFETAFAIKGVEIETLKKLVRKTSIEIRDTSGKVVQTIGGLEPTIEGSTLNTSTANPEEELDRKDKDPRNRDEQAGNNSQEETDDQPHGEHLTETDDSVGETTASDEAESPTNALTDADSVNPSRRGPPARDSKSTRENEHTERASSELPRDSSSGHAEQHVEETEDDALSVGNEQGDDTDHFDKQEPTTAKSEIGSAGRSSESTETSGGPSQTNSTLQGQSTEGESRADYLQTNPDSIESFPSTMAEYVLTDVPEDIDKSEFAWMQLADVSESVRSDPALSLEATSDENQTAQSSSKAKNPTESNSGADQSNSEEQPGNNSNTQLQNESPPDDKTGAKESPDEESNSSRGFFSRILPWR